MLTVVSWNVYSLRVRPALVLRYVVHDREARSWPQPSDHVPLRATFDVA